VEPLSWTDDMLLRAERPETPMLLNYDQTTATRRQSHHLLWVYLAEKRSDWRGQTSR
jgi:hypothetical protein